MRIFVLSRHGRSVLNAQGIVNGDQLRDPGLGPEGVEEGHKLAGQLSALAIEVVVVSPFPRALETAAAALEGREVPRVIDDDLGDIRIGDLDGGMLAAYRRATAHDDRNRPFPGGESLNEAAHRYANAFERLLSRTERVSLVVCHEYPVRYALNAAGGSDDFDLPFRDIPNATPYLFDEAALGRAVTRIRELAR